MTADTLISINQGFQIIGGIFAIIILLMLILHKLNSNAKKSRK